MEIENFYDVVVIGAGPSGVCAAVGTARQGAKTLLVERYGFLGGLMTAGMVVPIHTFHNMRGEQIVKGIADEIIDRLAQIGEAYKEKHPVSVYRSAYTHTPFNVEGMKRVLFEICEESNVELLLGTFFFGTEVKDGFIDYIKVLNKSGIEMIHAKYFIDTTGDGDVAAASGANFVKGDSSGKCMAGSLMIQIGGVNDKKIIEYIKENPEDFVLAEDPFLKITNKDLANQIKTRKDITIVRGYFSLVKKAKKMKDFDLNRNQIMFIFPPNKGQVYANIANVFHVDGSNAKEISFAEIETRRQVPKIMDFLKKYIPGFENCYLIQTAPQLGIRESRRIIGDYILSKDDVLNGVSFNDSIARGAYPSDIHTPDGGVQHIFIRDGKDYGIPFRCLLPKGLENLIVAGRSISCDRIALGTIRNMAQCMATGQAAGTSVGICVKNSLKKIRELPIDELRDILIKQGAIV